MAEEGSAVDDMGLDLEHADSVIELCGDIEVLVCGDIVWLHEGRVMGTDLSYVAVSPVAKLRVEVAGCCVRWHRS